MNWKIERAAALGLTLAQYEAYADLDNAYSRDECEGCQCEWDGGYGDDGTICKRIAPNPLCNRHRAEDWQERMELTRPPVHHIVPEFQHTIYWELGVCVGETFSFFDSGFVKLAGMILPIHLDIEIGAKL